MIIEKVKICNFGPFQGEHEILFPGNGTGVHIIRGKNGQGKTSIQRAILWCLYGTIVDRKGKEVPPTSLLNHQARNEDLYQFYVSIFFNHEGVQWSIFRKMEASKHSDNRYRDGMDVNVIRDGAVQPNPQQVIERIIPRDVSRYFFFDGEMLRDYEDLLDETSPRAFILRDAIERILGVHYFRIARDDLYSIKKRVESDRTKVVKKLGGKQYEELAAALQQITEDIHVREESIKTLEKELEDFNATISDKMREMADLQEVKELGKNRLELKLEIEGLEKQKENKLVEMNKHTAKVYKAILFDSARTLLRQLELKHEAVTAKYAEKQQLIGQSKMIKAGIAKSKCNYCGTILDEDKLDELTKELADIEDQIHSLTQIPEPNHEFEDSKNILEKMLSENIDREKFKEIQAQISLIEHKTATKEEEMAQVEAKLGDPALAETARNLEKEIQGMLKEQGKMEERITGLKERLQEDLPVKGEFERQLASISRVELDELTARINLLDSTGRVFEEAISEYRTEKRKEVETNASDIFKKLRSKEYYEKLSINDQYGLSIITKNKIKIDRSEWRSSGEEQLVALSLIGALNKCAQIKAPVLMDTPFGRLDIEHGKRVLSYIPNLSEQVILLVTDREFRKGDEVYLDGKIKSDFTVKYSDEEGSKIFATRGGEE